MKQKEIWDARYKRNLSWKKETAELPVVLKGKRVLELGVGNGKTITSILRQEPLSVTAIDFSSVAIDKAKEKFGNKISLDVADATRLPFKDKSFDVVVAYYVLNNSLKKDREKIVGEIYRVLGDDGICIFEDFSIHDFRKIGKMSEDNTFVKKDGLICHFFDEREIRELFGRFKTEIKKARFNPIKSKKNLTREILKVVARK